MRITKEDIKAAKTCVYVQEELKKVRAAAPNAQKLTLKGAQKTNYAAALSHLKSRFGKDWLQMANDIITIEFHKTKFKQRQEQQ